MFSFRLDPGTDGAGVAFVGDPGQPYPQLDLSDGGEHAERSWQRISDTLGVAPRRVRQVHGRDVVRVRAGEDPTVLAATPADAMVSDIPGLALVVRAADCLPVLFVDAEAHLIGAAHAGRVGLVAGVLEATVSALADLGASRLTAWIGPHICGTCYEVPAPMREEVAAQLPAAWSRTAWGTPGLDLGAAAESVLVGLGVAVSRRDRCTLTETGLHSFRRDGAASGRGGGLVWLP